MDLRTEKKIYALSALCGLLTALAFVVPRFGPGSEGGLAGATAAVMAFLGVLTAAAGVSVYLLVITLRARSRIGRGARFAGTLPGVVLVTGVVWLVFFLRY